MLCLRVTSYDTGLNGLFEDKAEELMFPDLSVESELVGKKYGRSRKPDRVFGLQETNNFENILDQVPFHSSGGPRTIRDSVQITPFKDTANPLLFPFLIVEAKSEKSYNGFADAEEQTAFPIKFLLDIQSNLRKRLTSITTPGPLRSEEHTSELQSL